MTKLTNKFIEHGSLWGNLYRHRYYIDGKRVTKAEWNRAFDAADIKPGSSKRDSGGGWYRLTWVG